LSRAPAREEFNSHPVPCTQINKLGVRIQTIPEATAETIKGAHPDTVIIATGSRPFIVPVPGWEQENVATPSQVLNSEVTAGERVIVYDATGFQEGPTVADFLAEKSRQVEMLTHFSSINTHWGLMTHMIGTHIPVIWDRLKRNGVTVTPLAMVKSIEGTTVTIADVITGEERIVRDVDTIVMATGYRSNNRLFQELRGQVGELYAVGDCALPRRVLDAINEGYMKAFDI
jgi:2-enoate reductase